MLNNTKLVKCKYCSKSLRSSNKYKYASKCWTKYNKINYLISRAERYFAFGLLLTLMTEDTGCHFYHTAIKRTSTTDCKEYYCIPVQWQWVPSFPTCYTYNEANLVPGCAFNNKENHHYTYADSCQISASFCKTQLWCCILNLIVRL